jgi:hypothetical protein
LRRNITQAKAKQRFVGIRFSSFLCLGIHQRKEEEEEEEERNEA